MDNRLFSQLSINKLTGIGESLEKKFNSLGIYSVKDLLLHFPLRYENRATITPINQVSVGEHCTIEGIILKTEVIKKRRRILVCTISDNSAIASLRFLHFNAGIQQSLQEGKWVKAYGEIKANQAGIEMIHPQLLVRSSQAALQIDGSEKFTPIYPTTYGLIQSVIRKCITAALILLKNNPQKEIFPDSLSKGLLPIEEAITTIHQPQLNTNIKQLEEGSHRAYKRLILEELLSYHLSMQISKAYNQKRHASPQKLTHRYVTPFLASLPFSLTQAQQHAIEDIWQDMIRPSPMMRLVQGDVGSGKTVVAALAALCAIENGKQVVLMAPTEILAEQHYFNFKNWFTPLSINVEWLSSRLTAKAKRERYENTLSGQITLLIGTHAVFYDKVQFKDLGLVIIDEQHRFGVNQRLNLWEKGIKDNLHPHQLIMTATPIPRTLAMTVYADLDLSIIDQLPPGRTPIQTIVISNSRRDEIIERIDQACQAGKQVYWVCTLVEESEAIDAQAAEMLFEDLKQQLPNITVGLVHGKMKSQLKQSVMQDFKQGTISLLVATTVIEVGVDVPNASLMVIENAERLGLAQLHQLRGRVGRGSVASHCVLMYQAPLSKVAKQRLEVMRNSNDGFVIAQKDLEIRGSGEILGTKQVGIADFKIVDLIRDQHMISEVQKISAFLLQHHPETVKALICSWLSDREKYINA